LWKEEGARQDSKEEREMGEDGGRRPSTAQTPASKDLLTFYLQAKPSVRPIIRAPFIRPQRESERALKEINVLL